MLRWLKFFKFCFEFVYIRRFIIFLQTQLFLYGFKLLIEEKLAFIIIDLDMVLGERL